MYLTLMVLVPQVSLNSLIVVMLTGVVCQSLSCHGCGVPGHIRTNCPNHVKRVKSITLVSNPDYITVLLNGNVCECCMIDSGSDVTLVSSLLVDSSYYTGSLNTYRSDVLSSCAPVAGVRLQMVVTGLPYDSTTDS